MAPARQHGERITRTSHKRTLIYTSRPKQSKALPDETMKDYYMFSNRDYLMFKKYLIEVYLQVNTTSNLANVKNFSCNGMPTYTLNAHSLGGGKKFITIIFFRNVKFQDGRFGKTFSIGGPISHKTQNF